MGRVTIHYFEQEFERYIHTFTQRCGKAPQCISLTDSGWRSNKIIASVTAVGSHLIVGGSRCVHLSIGRVCQYPTVNNCDQTNKQTKSIVS